MDFNVVQLFFSVSNTFIVPTSSTGPPTLSRLSIKYRTLLRALRGIGLVQTTWQSYRPSTMDWSLRDCLVDTSLIRTTARSRRFPKRIATPWWMDQ
jgi:hypothetical protein